MRCYRSIAIRIRKICVIRGHYFYGLRGFARVLFVINLLVLPSRGATIRFVTMELRPVLFVVASGQRVGENRFGASHFKQFERTG